MDNNKRLLSEIKSSFTMISKSNGKRLTFQRTRTACSSLYKYKLEVTLRAARVKLLKVFKTLVYKVFL